MDHSDFIVCSFMANSNCLKSVNIAYMIRTTFIKFGSIIFQLADFSILASGRVISVFAFCCEGQFLPLCKSQRFDKIFYQQEIKIYVNLIYLNSKFDQKLSFSSQLELRRRKEISCTCNARRTVAIR